jgi:protocatechuate 3,4-dioxygenase, beta subunit
VLDLVHALTLAINREIIGRSFKKIWPEATMDPNERRRFLNTLTFAVLGTATLSPSSLFAETLAQTARLGEGPFYPDKMPLDTDNDLLILNDSISPAVGQITHLTGRLLSAAGEPVRNAFIEIWQVDNKASYIHTDGANSGGRDRNFQGYGRFLTDSKGQYYFRTIKPVSYTLQGQFRTAHIHYAVSRNGKRIYTTQMHIKGHEDNTRDFILNGIRDAKARESVLVDFKRIEGSKIGELAANFDIVMGYTAAELQDGSLQGGIGKPEGLRPNK